MADFFDPWQGLGSYQKKNFQVLGNNAVVDRQSGAQYGTWDPAAKSFKWSDPAFGSWQPYTPPPNSGSYAPSTYGGNPAPSPPAQSTKPRTRLAKTWNPQTGQWEDKPEGGSGEGGYSEGGLVYDFNTGRFRYSENANPRLPPGNPPSPGNLGGVQGPPLYLGPDYSPPGVRGGGWQPYNPYDIPTPGLYPDAQGPGFPGQYDRYAGYYDPFTMQGPGFRAGGFSFPEPAPGGSNYDQSPVPGGGGSPTAPTGTGVGQTLQTWLNSLGFGQYADPFAGFLQQHGITQIDPNNLPSNLFDLLFEFSNSTQPVSQPGPPQLGPGPGPQPGTTPAHWKAEYSGRDPYAGRFAPWTDPYRVSGPGFYLSLIHI